MKRRGAPWSFNAELCYQELAKAKQERQAQLPIYSREISDPVVNGVSLLKTHKFVLVEGIYLLWKDDKAWNKLYELWDERWFVKCPSRSQQIQRLVQRSLKFWTESKTALWGAGEVGARKRTEFNDVLNMDLVQQCEGYADEIIVNP
jgi:pantothenate kinase